MDQNSDPYPKLGQVRSTRALRAHSMPRLHAAALGRTRWAPGRDAKAKSRPTSLAQPHARSRHQNLVATSSRPVQVATTKRGTDTVSVPFEQTRSRPQNQVATPSNPYQVATSERCCDLTSAHRGISKLRHQKPGHDLPHCRPCHDINSMSRHRFLLSHLQPKTSGRQA